MLLKTIVEIALEARQMQLY